MVASNPEADALSFFLTQILANTRNNKVVLTGSIELQPTHSIVSVDCTNAFNTVNRSTILHSVGKRLPALAGLVNWAYGSPSSLIWKDSIIPSTCGSKQGDPLGGALFCMALQEVLEELKTKHPAVTIVAYMDDINLAGENEACVLAFSDLVRLLADIGLVVNSEKCQALIAEREGGAGVAW